LAQLRAPLLILNDLGVNDPECAKPRRAAYYSRRDIPIPSGRPL
jgi:hypothetical protein